jgi:hypothetical protein
MLQIPPALAMYQFMQQWGMPSVPSGPSHMNGFMPGFMPPTPISPSGPGPTTVYQTGPSAPTGNTSIVDAAAAWCRQYNLGDEELRCLQRLGFRVGDNLNDLTDEMWNFAEALPLCRMRIIRAYKSSLQSPAPIG